MKKNWKSDKTWPDHFLGVSITNSVLIFLVIFYSQCNHINDHIGANKTGELDGLVKPTTQTVFSHVKTISPVFRSISPAIIATGVISYNPKLINTISARYNGRIEKLYVRYNFENIAVGQRIMDIYSPEILTAQEDLIYILKNSANNRSLLNSSKQKLQLLGLTIDQLKQIERDLRPINPLPVYSSYNGHIHDVGLINEVASQSVMNNNQMNANERNSAPDQIQIENLPSSKSAVLSIKEGMYIQSGQALFSVYNTSKVWAMINIFPNDASHISVGDSVSIVLEDSPKDTIRSIISYVEPVTGPNGSAIRARVYIDNTNNTQIKVGTLFSSKITSTAITGLWLPRKAIVDLGQNQIVFLKTEDHFISKFVKVGIHTDSLVQILSGLNIEQKVAENAEFMVDSESFIQSDKNGK